MLGIGCCGGWYKLLCRVTCTCEEFWVNPVGQDKIFNRAQWPVPGMAHNKMVFMICTMGMWIYTMDIWILYSPHIDFAQWTCGFWPMVRWGRPIEDLSIVPCTGD
jgi:hypothetical protein